MELNQHYGSTKGSDSLTGNPKWLMSKSGQGRLTNKGLVSFIKGITVRNGRIMQEPIHIATITKSVHA
jgi:hypothetical protein